jgi:signal transduction histidine kinase
MLDRYQRLIELSRDVASTLELGALLERIVSAAADLCCAQAASILLYDEAKQQLHFEATNNLDQPAMRGMIVPVSDSIAGWIVNNKQALIINDAQSDPRHFKNVDQATSMTTASILGVPMMAKDKVVGVLEAINKFEGEFDQQDQSLLMALGAQAAIAIENARLFQQSDLISELVHELRTPLTSLNTAARLLQNPQTPDEMRDNLSSMVLEEVGRLSEMTTAFLDLSKLESARTQFQFEEFEVPPLVEECTRVIKGKAVEQGLQLILEVPEGLPQLRADRDKIKQVLLNLLSNAVKYNSPDGKITLNVEAVPGEMHMRVTDTGPGIPPEYLPKLFEKFYRVPGLERKAQGTGLGLSICKRIAEAHNGSMSVQSRVGVGTTFELSLPLHGVS